MRKRTPRQVRDPMAAITRRMPLADDQKRDLGIAYRIQLQAMLRGAGTEEAWSTLACSINVAMVLSEHGIVANAGHCIKRSQDALILCRDRSNKVGKWGFTGDEAKAVMRACAIHDEQLELATKAQITSALNDVYRRLTEDLCVN